jgi:hypothetical protein
MLTEPIYSLGNPGTFDITDKDDPLYYIARIAHEQSVDRYNLNDEGFEYRQDEGTDFSTVATAWDTYLSSLDTWYTSAVAASNAGSSIPAVPTLPTLPTDPLTNIVLQIVFRVAVQIGITWLKKKLDPNTEAKELSAILKKAFLDGDGESLLYVIQNTPLEIVISRHGEYQDFFYSDRPEV